MRFHWPKSFHKKEYELNKKMKDRVSDEIFAQACAFKKGKKQGKGGLMSTESLRRIRET